MNKKSVDFRQHHICLTSQIIKIRAFYSNVLIQIFFIAISLVLSFINKVFFND